MTHALRIALGAAFAALLTVVIGTALMAFAEGGWPTEPQRGVVASLALGMALIGATVAGLWEPSDD